MSLSVGRSTGRRGAPCAPWLLLLLLVGEPAARGDSVLPSQRVQLANGMEILLHEDYRTPFVAVNMSYRAGALYESAEDAGMGHLIQHLMQAGTQHTAPWSPVFHLAGAGAVRVGQSIAPEIRFFGVLPSANLETALWVESDRMGFLLPSVTDALIAHGAQEITRERETQLATEPYAAARQKAWTALFPPAHPLSRVRATPSPQRMNVAAVKQTLRRAFAPSNATLVLVGDFDTAALLPRLRKYFGELPSEPRPQAPPVPRVALSREVIIRHEESLGRLPLLEVSYLVPPSLSEGGVAASLLAKILSRGHEGRLDRLLVSEQRLAVRVESDVKLMRGQSVLTLSIFAEQEPQLGRSLAVLDKVLTELAERGVTAEELLAVRRHLRNETILALHPIEAKAHWLQTTASAGVPDGAERDLALLEKARSEDLQELVRTSCQPNQRVLLFATPATQTRIIQQGIQR